MTAAAPAATLDIVFLGEDEGGTPVDLSAFHGRGNISLSELSGSTATYDAVDASDAYAMGDARAHHASPGKLSQSAIRAG